MPLPDPPHREPKPRTIAPNSKRKHASLEAPQFRLSTLMLLITSFSGVLAASLVLPPLMTFALVLLLAAIVAHVAGNYLGTKLRNSATELSRSEQSQTEQKEVWREVVQQTREAIPRSRLTDRSPVGIAITLFIALGVIASTTAGSYWLSTAQTEPPAWPDFLMGCFAFAVLGAIWGFAVGGFVCIGYRTIKHSIEQSNHPPK